MKASAVVMFHALHNICQCYRYIGVLQKMGKTKTIPIFLNFLSNMAKNSKKSGIHIFHTL